MDDRKKKAVPLADGNGNQESTHGYFTTDQDRVAILKSLYPGMDKTLYSKTKRPSRYGIQLVHDARVMIGEAKKRPEHKGSQRFTFRAEAALLRRINRFMKDNGIGTAQEFLTRAVLTYLKGVEE